MNNKQWFKEAKFGMMIHWGLYSLLGGEYRGERMWFVAEWIRNFMHIPHDEYISLQTLSIRFILTRRSG